MNVAPENRQGDNKPDVQYVPVCCKGKYKQKDSHEEIGEPLWTNIKKRASDEHRKAGKNR
jgi:hypothetical protein